jgi:hypothetical protein
MKPLLLPLSPQRERDGVRGRREAIKKIKAFVFMNNDHLR